MNYLLEETTIPNILWQTYKTDSIPNQAKPLIKSWLDKNPNLQWYFMDDTKCQQFIQDHFNQEFYNMYISLPFGVMKADVWRVAVVYVYGGIYADTDCECIKPISEWLNFDDRLIVGEEMDNGDLYNCIFAAEPNHPALLSVLNKFMELYNDPNFLKDPNTPIQNFGQYGFSRAILDYYKENPNDIKIIPKKENIFSTIHKYDTSCVIHHVASLKWRDNYDSWRKEQIKLK